MKTDKLQKAKLAESKIRDKKELLFAYEKFFDTEQGNDVTVRIRGTNFTLPKGIFNAELQKKITATKKDIKDLEAELDNL